MTAHDAPGDPARGESESLPRRLLPMILVTTVLVVAALMLVGALQSTQARFGAAMIALVTVGTLVARRNTYAGMLLLVVGSWLWITAAMFAFAGITSATMTLFPLPIALSGWMLGRRWLIVMTALSVGTVLAFGMFEHLGWYEPRILSPAIVRTAIQVTVLVLTGIIVGTAYDDFRAARQRALEYGDRIARDNVVLARREQEVSELNAELESRVEARTADLAQALETLQRARDELVKAEAHATFGALVASVSHDLASPLGNALMAATTLQENAADFNAHLASGQLRRSELTALSSSLADGTDIIARNLRRAEELLRKFKQVAADQASEQRRRFDLAETVGEVVTALTPAIRRQGHRVDIDIPSGIVCDSYPGPLGQVLVNLINNAFLHAFEGRADGRVRIAAGNRDDRVVISVGDDGSGMNAEVRERLFQPYFSTKIGKGGTGLGMTIVDTIVRKTLGGTLSVDSSPGRGTRIDIDMPRLAPPPRP